MRMASAHVTGRRNRIPSMEAKVRGDQGPHEVEVTESGESGLHQALIDCTKNPGHTNFIPVDEFSQSHLPVGYQNNLILECIKAHADLTVRVNIEHISMNRPEYHPGTTDPYPFYSSKGESISRKGTGWVFLVEDKYTEQNNEDCPCRYCLNSPTPMKRWGQIQVSTAMHTVYNTEEAEQTICELFYDKREDRGKVPKLIGIDVYDSDVKKDQCHMTCITHDLDLWEKLKAMRLRCDNLQRKLGKIYGNSSDHKLTAIVSHPHGYMKHISIGEWKEAELVGGIYTRYVYSNATCPGSSGAPVYILGRSRNHGSTNHGHSRRSDTDGLNVSWVGVW